MDGVTRRLMLRSLGAAAGMGFLGRAHAGGAPLPIARPSRLRLAPVNVSRDRLLRTVVGLRPFRPSGFVVRSDKVGAQTVVHHYGHGGCGVTLSWGTAELAADEVARTGEKRIAVLGCGAVGLATARVLQQRGLQAT